MKRYHLWLIDTNGTENTFTVNLTKAQAQSLLQKLEIAKRPSPGLPVLSDFALLPDKPLDYQEALKKISEGLNLFVEQSNPFADSETHYKR